MLLYLPVIFIFPPIHEIVDQLLGNIVEHAEHDENMKHIPYKNVIHACGGRGPVAEAILASIDPIIRGLEGKPITKDAYVIRESAAFSMSITDPIPGDRTSSQGNPRTGPGHS